MVKTALIQHLEFDSKVTLGVLCDQIVPPDDPMEDEDRTIRERLCALVVAFLAEDARQPLLAQLQRQGRSAAEQEDALIDTLIKVRGIRSPPTGQTCTDARPRRRYPDPPRRTRRRSSGTSSSSCPRSTTDTQRAAGTTSRVSCSRAPARRSGTTSRPGGTPRVSSGPARTSSWRTSCAARRAPRTPRCSCASIAPPRSWGR